MSAVGRLGVLVTRLAATIRAAFAGLGLPVTYRGHIGDEFIQFVGDGLSKAGVFFQHVKRWIWLDAGGGPHF